MNVLKISLIVSGFLFLVLFVVLWLLNRTYTDVTIPIVHIVAVAILYMAYLWVLAAVFWQWVQKRLKRGIVALVLYVVLGYTVVAVVDFAVYRVFPLLSIRFFDESAPRNDVEFHYEIWRGYIFANALAGAFVLLLHHVKRRYDKRTMEKELATYRTYFREVQHSSHFLKSVFVSSFGNALIEEEHKDRQTKRDVIQFMGYLMRLEKTTGQHEWEDELDLLYCLVRLMHRHYGVAALSVRVETKARNCPALPWGLLLFPLENCLKHARISAEHPIDYRLSVYPGRIEVVCTNYWSPKEKEETGDTGFGLLESRVSGSEYNLEYDSVSVDEQYKLTLVLNWDDHEKAILPAVISR